MSRSEKLHCDGVLMTLSLNQRNVLFLTPFQGMNAFSLRDGSVMLLIKPVNPVIFVCA